MITLPTLTPQLLDTLGKELGGCDFSGEHQKAFLSNTGSCDVQAAPGNGKTTLLVAKLALLSRSWRSHTQGVCVISHTNAAREEVEKKLFKHPTASAFLSYPHFIGTVTAFIDRYLALPYLRGLGWSIERIDDEVFGASAVSRWRSKPALVRFARMRQGNRRSLEEFVRRLELAPDFESKTDTPPLRLKLRHRYRQPGPNSPTGIALEELKAELVAEGLYRFGDMNAIALQAIRKYPPLIARIRQRFPLVLLDEAQDTNGIQLALLDQLFGNGVAYQRLGDQNQTLYEDEDLSTDDYWNVGDDAIPLNKTRRFGQEIATFASRLTVRATQQIDSLSDAPNRRTMILFDEDTITDVLPAYGEEIREHWPSTLPPNHDIRAVASRHSPTTDKTGQWPKTLVDYYPPYRSGRGRHGRPNTLCSAFRQAALLHQRDAPPSEIVNLLTSGLTALLRVQGWQNSDDSQSNRRNLWNRLAAYDSGLPQKLRRLLMDNILYGSAAWSSDGWVDFVHSVTNALQIEDQLTPAAVAFLEFVDEAVLEAPNDSYSSSQTIYEHDGIPIRLGSIHSVKGKTVDAILVVETEVRRGPALSERAMDLATILPHALGLEDHDFSRNVAQLAAATNIFVAVTRPREVLCCAVRRTAVNRDLVYAAQIQGWHIRDLIDADAEVSD